MKIKILVWEERTRKNISLEELESMSGISSSTLNRIENGKTSPTLDKLGKIAEALNVEVEDLFKTHNNNRLENDVQ
jgi:transcriptional regulator with XRE-family HTH domain